MKRQNDVCGFSFNTVSADFDAVRSYNPLDRETLNNLYVRFSSKSLAEVTHCTVFSLRRGVSLTLKFITEFKMRRTSLFVIRINFKKITQRYFRH